MTFLCPCRFFSKAGIEIAILIRQIIGKGIYLMIPMDTGVPSPPNTKLAKGQITRV